MTYIGVGRLSLIKWGVKWYNWRHMWMIKMLFLQHLKFQKKLWSRSMACEFKGCFDLVQAMLKMMLCQKWGQETLWMLTKNRKVNKHNNKGNRGCQKDVRTLRMSIGVMWDARDHDNIRSKRWWAQRWSWWRMLAWHWGHPKKK